MKKLVITEVDNGWIVEVGETSLREQHARVFNHPDEFVEWVDKFFDIPGKMKREDKNED